jgi:hypothetical protein
MEKNNKRIIYPMSKLHKMLSDEEIKKYSERFSFNEEDEFFHMNAEEEFLESLSEEDIKFYNENVPTDKILIKLTA